MTSATSAAPAPALPGRTVGDLWRFRMLAATLARHHLLLKYRNSLLGFVWTLLGPLGNMVVLVMVFSFIVRIPLERYWAFLLSGYFVWVFVQHVVGASTTLFRDYSALRRSVAFPNEVVILGAAGARMAEFLAELALIVGVLSVFHHGGLPLAFVALPALIALQCVLVFGLTLPLATLSLLYHDVEHALPIGLGLLFYASPVFYPASMVPEAVRHLYLLNPVAGLLTMYHQVLYEGRLPELAPLLLTTGTSVALLLAGYAFFNRHRGVLPEIA
jgi:ABC-2 type transport system permease protein